MIQQHRHDLVGYNSRLDTLQAAVLRVKLRHLDEWNPVRRENAQLYDEMLSEIPDIITPARLNGTQHVYHLSVIRVERVRRDDLRQFLHERGIHTGIHYPAPVHLTGGVWGHAPSAAHLGRHAARKAPG